MKLLISSQEPDDRSKIALLINLDGDLSGSKMPIDMEWISKDPGTKTKSACQNDLFVGSSYWRSWSFGISKNFLYKEH